MKTRASLLCAAVAALAFAQPAPGWNSARTSAGIVEQAALSATLHQHLIEMLGSPRGLFTSMRVPRPDAPALYEVLDKLNPANGYVPDPSGRQLALAWLAAGAALADTPAEHAVNHFFDPSTGRGAKSAGGTNGLRDKLARVAVREKLVTGGMPATEWLSSPENPMNVGNFYVQLDKALSSKTPAERERHAAAALIAAGALVHVVADMASPAHVRGDLDSFFDKISGDETDVGSRFEELGAIAFGRLGVPRADAVTNKTKLVEFITSADGTGLADHVSTRYFSKNTLPRSISVRRGESGASISAKVTSALRRPKPSLSGPFNLSAARNDGGARLENASGTCLAHYHLEGARLWFSIPDSCALEQIGELLPLASSYSAGVIAHLFRGSLELRGAGSMLSVNATDPGLGAGTVTAYWDDELGVRTQYARLDSVPGAKANASLGQIAAPPAAAKAVAVSFVGVDKHGQAVVAARTTAWPLPTKKKR